MGLISTPDERFTDLPGFPYETNYVDVGDPRMAYVDEGRGEETFLCLHGEPTWSYLYRKMIPVLSERGRVVAPDFLGFGRSDKYDDHEAYSYGMLYDALERFVTSLDLSNVTLICQDWGGLLGLPLAANHPERFARLVPMNTGLPDGTERMPDVWYEFKQMAESAPDLDVGRMVASGCLSDLAEDVRAAYAAPFPDESHMAGVRTLPGLVPRSQAPDLRGGEVIAEARATFESWEKPVFVLFSDSDPITGPSRDDLRSLFPTAAEQPDVRISGAGHFLQEDAGEAVAREIVDFVDRTA